MDEKEQQDSVNQYLQQVTSVFFQKSLHASSFLLSALMIEIGEEQDDKEQNKEAKDQMSSSKKAKNRNQAPHQIDCKILIVLEKILHLKVPSQ